jgi:hypothetical protein
MHRLGPSSISGRGGISGSHVDRVERVLGAGENTDRTPYFLHGPTDSGGSSIENGTMKG